MTMSNLCIVVADAGRARLFTFDPRTEPGDPPAALIERLDLTDPERRLAQREIRSDAPGRDQTPAHRGFGLDDGREDRTREVDRAFAIDIAEQVAGLIRSVGCRRLVVAAPPHMLGLLRPLTQMLRRRGVAIDDLARDLTRLPAGALHDHLADAGLLPARTRLAPS
jgi:protein required for attachment to host cells